MTLKNQTFAYLFLSLLLLNSVNSLVIGTTNQNNLLNFPLEVDGSFVNSKLVLDGNWHWFHSATDMGHNCYPNGWDPTICPNPQACWNACAIEGVPNDQWSGNYGIHAQGDSLTLGYVTKHQYGTNVGSRLYVMDALGQKYMGLNMLGR